MQCGHTIHITWKKTNYFVFNVHSPLQYLVFTQMKVELRTENLAKWKMAFNCTLMPGVVEGVQDWSDRLRKTSTRQSLVRPKFCIYKTLTSNDKSYGLNKVGVVGRLPPHCANAV